MEAQFLTLLVNDCHMVSIVVYIDYKLILLENGT